MVGFGYGVKVCSEWLNDDFSWLEIMYLNGCICVGECLFCC